MINVNYCVAYTLIYTILFQLMQFKNNFFLSYPLTGIVLSGPLLPAAIIAFLHTHKTAIEPSSHVSSISTVNNHLVTSRARKILYYYYYYY